MPNYQFDALQYCRRNLGRYQMANGRDPMELIAAELERNLYIIEVWKRKPAMNVQRKYDALVEAVKKMLESYKRAEECSCPYCLEDLERERAEVDRLIANCKGDG